MTTKKWNNHFSGNEQTINNKNSNNVKEDKHISFFQENVLDLKNEKYDEFCNSALEYAECLKEGNVTTSMIRKIYSRVLNANTVMEIKHLRPHFAYTAGRYEKNFVLKKFMNLLDFFAKNMEENNEQHLVNFKQFMEAIVAYRKYVGKDN